jgi:hypothetical protein
LIEGKDSQRVKTTLPFRAVSYASSEFSGGGESQIILDRGTSKQVLYAKTVAQFNGAGRSGSQFYDGYFIVNDVGRIKNARCVELGQPVNGRVAASYLKRVPIIPH